MSDLKPCPFCGGTKIKRYGFRSSDLHGFIHVCEINGEAMVKIESRFFKTEEEATEAWNRRAVNVPDTNVGDTVSRQAAIEAVERAKTAMSTDGEIYCAKINAQMNIQLLPAAHQPTQLDLDMAYMRGKIDGINECTEKVRKLKESINV